MADGDETYLDTIDLVYLKARKPGDHRPFTALLGWVGGGGGGEMSETRLCALHTT